MRYCFSILFFLMLWHGVGLSQNSQVLTQPSRPAASLENLPQEILDNFEKNHNSSSSAVSSMMHILNDTARHEEYRGQLTIEQDKRIDTLINRAISNNKKAGISGVRIQIYYSSVRTAREEASKIRAEFMAKFPNMPSYIEYQEPGWFKVRVGNYHNKLEAYKDLVLIREAYPEAYSVFTPIESQFAED